MDQTARNNASAALEKGSGSVSFSSSSIFTTFGAQTVTRVGKMASLHIFFSINSALSGNNAIATIPAGFRPYSVFGSVPLIPTYQGSAGTVEIGKNGVILGQTGFATGNYLLDFSYPID